MNTLRTLMKEVRQETAIAAKEGLRLYFQPFRWAVQSLRAELRDSDVPRHKKVKIVRR